VNRKGIDREELGWFLVMDIKNIVRLVWEEDFLEIFSISIGFIV
jgi:hypothetical protein